MSNDTEDTAAGLIILVLMVLFLALLGAVVVAAWKAVI